jgi:hypothetical protein
MLAAFMLFAGAVVLAVLLAVLLPGAGLIVGAIVLVLGIAAAVWLGVAAGTRTTTAEIVDRSSDPDPLGPGGPDDPSR